MKLYFSRSLFSSKKHSNCFLCSNLKQDGNMFICSEVLDSLKLPRKKLEYNFKKCKGFKYADNWKLL